MALSWGLIKKGLWRPMFEQPLLPSLPSLPPYLRPGDDEAIGLLGSFQINRGVDESPKKGDPNGTEAFNGAVREPA